MKRKIIVIVIVMAIIGVFMVVSNLKTGVDANIESSPEIARYYATRDSSIFLKLAKVVDDVCFYLVDSLISGISTLFSLFLG